MQLAIIYKDFAAINSGVSHVGLGVASINTAAVLKREGVDATAVPVTKYTDVVTYIHSQPFLTRVAIQAAWVTVSEFEGLLKTFPKIKFTCISHSNIGFLAVEPAAIKLFREYKALQEKYKNFIVSGNSEKFTEAWTKMYSSTVKYLPNLYHLGARKSYKPLPTTDPLKIGCFGAIRPLKNFTSAVAAAIELATIINHNVEIYMSSGRDEGGSVTSRAIDELVAGLPNVKLIKSIWRDHASFRKLIGQMDLLLQPSYTETFNMITADGVAENVPSVVSDSITWAPKSWVARADDVGNIAFTGIELLKNKNEQVELGRERLTNYILNGINHWNGWLLS